MRLLATWTRVLSLGLALVVAACADGQAPAAYNGPLRVLFLAEVETERTRDFEAFLVERFGPVHVADRWSWDRALLEHVDVVVVDWPQQDGISKWMLAGDRTVPPRSPLGARAKWHHPTVLVGSAGLNTAWAWDVKGAFG